MNGVWGIVNVNESIISGIQSTNDSLEEKIILPNLTGGYDLKTEAEK